MAETGDNYDIISTELSLWMWELLSFNDCEKDQQLAQGDVVYLEMKKKKAKSEYHIVKEDETLHFISQLHGMKLASLQFKNRLKKDQNIQVGQKLFLRKRKSRR